MILSGEKKEEYRELKTYWTKRLGGESFDIVRFRNGYGKNAPTFDIECKSITYGSGLEKWGYKPLFFCYVIKLGKIKN